jgi:hypothetical protein
MADSRTRHDFPAAALLIVAGTIALMVGVGTRAIDLGLTIGPENLHHWFSWAGALFIALFTPVFYVLNRRRGERHNALLGAHVYGGLLAIALVSAHFTQHVTRPAAFYPDLGTGVVLYAAVVLSAMTGFLIRYRLVSKGARHWRALHTGAAVTFYLTIVVHVMRGLGIL